MSDTSRKIESKEIQPAGNAGTHLESSIIPSFFWLGGLKINVDYDDTLAKSKSVIGEARYCQQQIVLDASVAPLQSLEQAFMHELAHWILFIMGEDDLRNNEKLVDLFAHFLYQARVTEHREAVPAREADGSISSQGE